LPDWVTSLDRPQRRDFADLLTGADPELRLGSTPLSVPDWARAAPGSARQASLLEPGAAAGSPSELSSYPDWLRRVDLSIQHGSERPRYYIETVQPLYRSVDRTYTLFVQPRFLYTDDDWTANLGLGYRQLFLDQRILGGLNVFYDYAENHRHYRFGTGLELLTRHFELRTNGYFPLSGNRKVSDGTFYKVFERALTGMDVEAGGPVPYLPFLKLYGSYAYYDYDKDFDSHIGKFRAEVKLARFLRLDVETWNDNKAPWQYRIGLAFALDLERPLESLVKPSAEPYPYKDMRHMTLHRVVRDHNVKVERIAKAQPEQPATTAALTVTVGSK
jgi:hypothetical protein